MSRAFAVLLLALATACSRAPGSAVKPVQARHASSRERLTELRAVEASLRPALDPKAQPPWIDVSGPDPYRLVPLGGGWTSAAFMGLLRGEKALVMLDRELKEQRRTSLPEAPTALCVTPDASTAWIGSRYASQLWAVDVENPYAFVFGKSYDVAPQAVADLACGEHGLVYLLPASGGDLLTLEAGKVRARRPAPPGALRLLLRGRYLLESSLFERSLRVLTLSEQGLPVAELGVVQHDGPLWAFDAVERDGSLLVAVAGAENKPLVRAHGEFENIDSFVWLYRVGSNGVQRLAELNVSAFGVIVPKAVHLEQGPTGVTVTLLAAGSGRSLRARFEPDLLGTPQVQTDAALPGVSDAVFESSDSVVYASPLLDAWVRQGPGGVYPVSAGIGPASPVRLGEALFFTELMSPENSSEGTHSRFTCETCHFEGGVDGRVHFTGRENVSVGTKPLFGLANNRPHFSRAMDPDLSSVSHNEFRVAGAGSGSDPWFTLETARFPWLRELGIERARLEPLELRAALLQFLYAFSHAPNPHSRSRENLTQVEADGAHEFSEHCASCHAPRLVSDDAASAVPFLAWPRLILSRNGPIVWARGDYAKVGILPYVHERGTRITSLRRLALKPRYFTNGSAPDLESVLARFREAPGGALHDSANGAADLPPLAEETRRSLLAFLRLL